VQYLGFVTAPDADAAKVAAVREFKLSAEQRRRLLVQEHQSLTVAMDAQQIAEAANGAYLPGHMSRP
jgi:hypothetical protein